MTTIVNGVLVSSRNIPLELQAVVSWVLQLVNQQVKLTCGACLAQGDQNTTQGAQLPPVTQPAAGTLVVINPSGGAVIAPN
jgi:hypothetical protein